MGLAVVFAAFAACAAASEPQRPPAGFENIFSGAVVSTYADGRHVKMWLEPGGGYQAVDRHLNRSAGKWTLEGRTLCMRQERPIPIPFYTYCSPLPADLTAPWSAKAPLTGEPITVTFAPGDRP